MLKRQFVITVALVIIIALFIGFRKTKTAIPLYLFSRSQEPTINETACKEKDGKWMTPRFGGESFCNLPLSDAGKQCVKGSECLSGLCLVDPETKRPACTKYWLEY